MSTNFANYQELGRFWFDLGFAAIPGNGKVPAVKWADLTTGHKDFADTRIDTAEATLALLAFRTRFRLNDQTFVILDSHVDPQKRLCVVDLDNPECYDWAVETFGETPLVVRSGREGGGYHLYYRSNGVDITSSAGLIGPEFDFVWDPSSDRFGRSHVDVKAAGSYVVSPGSMHKSGKVYYSSNEITAELLDSLPIFDNKKYEALKSATKARRHSVARERTITEGIENARNGISFRPYSNKSSLPREQEVTLANGSRGTLGELSNSLQKSAWHKCYCPFHYTSGNPAGAIRVEPSGRTTLRCFSVCDTVWTMVDDISVKKGAEVTVDKWWCPEIKKQNKVTLVVSSTGSGKTTQMAKLARGYSRTVSVAPTRFLSRQAAGIYGQKSYEDASGNITAPKVSVCLPSLLRLDTTTEDGIGYELWLLDEVDQLLDQLHSQCVIRKGNNSDRDVQYSIGGDIFTHLSNHLRITLDLGGQIVAASGTATQRDVEMLALLCGVAAEDIDIIRQPAGLKDLTGIEETVFESYGEITGALLEHAKKGGKGTVSCDTQKAVEVITSRLGKIAKPNGLKPKVLAIHADDGQARNWPDINKEWDKYDFVVYNQACGSGISYTGSAHTTHWHIGDCWIESTSSMQLQLWHRNRTAKTRFSWLMEIDRPGNAVTLNEVTEVELSKTHFALTYTGMDDGTPKFSPKDQDFFLSHCWSIYVQSLSTRNPRDDFYSSLSSRGVFLRPSAANAAAKREQEKLNTEAAEAIKAEKVDAVVKATVTTAEMRELCNEFELDDEQRAKVVRGSTLSFWGSAREDLVEDTLGCRHKRRAAKLFTAVAAYLDGHEEELKIQDTSLTVGSKNEVYSAQATNAILPKVKATLFVLEAAGFSDADVKTMFSGDKKAKKIEWNLGTLERMNFVSELHAADRHLGLSLFCGKLPLANKDATKFLGIVLRQLGITVEGSGNGRVNKSISLDSLEQWKLDCRRQYDLLVGNTVDNPFDLTAYELETQTVLERLREKVQVIRAAREKVLRGIRVLTVQPEPVLC